VILVANKIDLERSRMISTEGKNKKKSSFAFLQQRKISDVYGYSMTPNVIFINILWTAFS